jgi:peptidoglycan-associated lipoprotein
MNGSTFRRFTPLFAVLLGAAALGACKKKGQATSPSEMAEVPAGEAGSACTQRSDCAGGLACTGGVCSSCTEDFDCAPYTCNLDSGRCDPMGACQADADCSEGEICDASMCVYSGGGGEAGVCGLDSVYFAFDSSVLTPANASKLESAAECLMDNGTAVYLEAHADNVGTEEYNIMLTERRGRSVVDFLADRGVTDDQLQVIAKGSLESIGSTESERAQDRRVDFIPQ